MELCSGKDLEVIQLHFPTKTKTIISQSCIPDHSSLWILKVELIYFPHSVRINSLWEIPDKDKKIWEWQDEHYFCFDAYGESTQYYKTRKK